MLLMSGRKCEVVDACQNMRENVVSIRENVFLCYDDVLWLEKRLVFEKTFVVLDFFF